MNKLKLSLQPSEAVVAAAAATIYAAYITTGRVTEGKEEAWMDRALQEALKLAHMADRATQSDNELG